VCREIGELQKRGGAEKGAAVDATALVLRGYDAMKDLGAFKEAMKGHGWDYDSFVLDQRIPATRITVLESTSDDSKED